MRRNLLVGKPFDDVSDDFSLAFGERVGVIFVVGQVGLVGNALFEVLHRGKEEHIFHFAVCTEVGFAVVDAEEHVAKQVARCAFCGSIIFNDDVFELLQLLVHRIVPFGVLLNAEIRDNLSGNEAIDVAENLAVLVFHVFAHLIHIFVVELKNEEGHLVLSRTVDRFEKFAAEVLKLEVEEEIMRSTEMAHEGRHVNFVHIERSNGGSFFHHVGDGQESIGVHLRSLAHFFYSTLTHAQLNAETADHLE